MFCRRRRVVSFCADFGFFLLLWVGWVPACLFCQWLLLHCVVPLVVLGRLPFMLVSTPSGSEEEKKEKDKSWTPISSTRRRTRTRTRRRKHLVVVVVKKKKKLKLELTLCFCWNRSWNKKRRRILGGEQEQEEQVFEVVLFCVGSKFSLVPRKGFGSLVVLFATEIFFCVWFWRRRTRTTTRTTREKCCGGGGGT